MGSLSDHARRAFQVRSLAAEDYGPCLQIWARCGQTVAWAWEDPTILMRLIKRNPSICSVAEHGDRIVGALLCGHDGARACLHHVAVDDTWRRRGIGSALVSRTLAELAKAGIQNIHAAVDWSTGSGMPFLRACGWQSQEDLAVLSLKIPARQHS